MPQYTDVKLLFITRKFPPMVGGMERMSHALSLEFKKQVDTTLISWNKSQKYLWFFLPVALLKALIIIPTHRITHVHLGDALLSPLGVLLGLLFNVQTSVTVAGLDVTFSFPPYQYIVPRCVAMLNKIICISHATKDECTKRGIPEHKCVVIPVGVFPEQFVMKATRKDLSSIIKKSSILNKRLLITVGRLVPRKGVLWFIESVFPLLSKKYTYIVVGGGPEKEKIESAVKNGKHTNSIFLLGQISDQNLKVLYNTADIFVMPNRRVPDNPEGFGIVALEAASTGLPVVAPDIDGIRDSVIDGKTGILCPPEDPKAFALSISSVSLQRSEVREKVVKRFHWNTIGSRYANILFSDRYE